MPRDPETTAKTALPTSLVWDPFVRLFHWVLVLTIAVAAVTGFLLGPRWLEVHIWSATLAVALVAMRAVWGVLGTTHARFSDFVTGPQALLRHVRQMRGGHAARHLGHNPLGGVMILALVGAILGLGLSGVFQLGGVFKTGPLAFLPGYSSGVWFADLHEVLAIALVILIVAHLAGAAFESLRTRENLPRAMVTGRKQARPGDHVSQPHLAHPWLALALIGPGLGLAVWAGLSLAARPGFGLPAQVLDPLYRQECADCHMAYSPSLLDRATWTRLMATLPDHFGEDASLPEDTAHAIRQWLLNHSAETADTKAAHLLALVPPPLPPGPSSGAAWKRLHQDIPDQVFNTPPVISRANCAACHADAESGRFYPPNINIPKDRLK